MKTELQERADVLAANLQRSIDACFEVLRSIGQLYGCGMGGAARLWAVCAA